MSTVPRQSQQQNPRGLLGGMAYNPLMSLGAGLLQAAGPSFEPQGLGQGLSQGLLNMQRAQQFQSMDADRKARAELLQKRAQLEQAKMQAEEEERARQEQLRLQQQAAIPHLVGLLPPEQQRRAQAYLNAYPGGGQGLFGSAFFPKPTTDPTPIAVAKWLADPNTTDAQIAAHFASRKAGAINIGTGGEGGRPDWTSLTSEQAVDLGIPPEQASLYGFDRKGKFGKRPTAAATETANEIQLFEKRASSALGAARTAVSDLRGSPDRTKWAKAKTALSRLASAVAQARNVKGEPGDILIKQVIDDLPSLLAEAASGVAGGDSALLSALDQIAQELGEAKPSTASSGDSELERLRQKYGRNKP